VGANCSWKICAFAVRSAPRAASSTAAALRSVSQLSVASRERSVAAGPAVVGVAASPWSEKVSVRHGTRTDDDSVAAEHGNNTFPIGKKPTQASVG